MNQTGPYGGLSPFLKCLLLLLCVGGLAACGTDTPPTASTAPTATTESAPPAEAPLPTPTLAAEEEAAVGTINGRVWHDVCVNEGDPPDGCVVDNAGSYQGNGVLDGEEPGIGSILINLGAGECPTIQADAGPLVGSTETIIAATTTDDNGDFVFAGLEAGSYCLMVDALHEQNRDLLLPGAWTTDTSGNRTITLAQGEVLVGINFGWDYQFLPLSESALNCRDQAQFVADVTIPDDTPIAPGTLFTKTWQLLNSGTCTWTPAYALTYVDGYELDGPSVVPLTATVPPSSTVNLSVPLVAPVISGTFRSEWQLYNANTRTHFEDASIWVQIVVTETTQSPEVDETSSITETVETPPDATGTPVPTATTAAATPAFENAAVSGLVWQDMCQVQPGEAGAPDTPAATCIEDGAGGYRANGLIDEEEPFLRNITISLYQGACPGHTLLATTQTNIGGGYVFTNLAPGTYCVLIDVFTPENVSLLSPGDWTYPEAGEGRVTLELGGGENRTDINFGWQFEQEGG